MTNLKSTIAHLKELLGEANARPWFFKGVYNSHGKLCDSLVIIHDSDGEPFPDESWRCRADNELIVEAVNNLPRLLAALEVANKALEAVKTGGGRAEILGLDKFRCPQCASAEIASDARAEIERILKGDSSE